jgi:hypothetical protein
MKDRPIPKKPRRIMILSLLGILIILFFFLPRPEKKDVEKPAQTPGIPRVEEATKNQEGKNPPYTIDVQYPKLMDTADAKMADKINADISREIDRAIASLKQNAGPVGSGDEKNGLTVRYEVAYLNSSIFSLALNESEYIAGAAHPDNFVTTMTYDLRNGNRIALGDLFDKDSDYLKIISDYSISALKKQMEVGDDEEDRIETINSGAAPTAQNYKNFLIAKEGLVIIFDTYQVGPGAAGIQRVAVPYSILEPVTNIGGLLPLRGTKPI